MPRPRVTQAASATSSAVLTSDRAPGAVTVLDRVREPAWGEGVAHDLDVVDSGGAQRLRQTVLCFLRSDPYTRTRAGKTPAAADRGTERPPGTRGATGPAPVGKMTASGCSAATVPGVASVSSRTFTPSLPPWPMG